MNHSGSFKPGNPGKPPGAVNKVSQKVREAVLKFLEDNIDQVQADYKSLKDPQDRLKFIADLIPYAVPKLQSTQLELSSDKEYTITFGSNGVKDNSAEAN